MEESVRNCCAKCESEKVICEQNKNVTKQSLIQQRFVEYAQKNSKRTAVIDALEKVTYGELLERAEYIAGYLRKEFVENSTGLVAIRMKNLQIKLQQ